MENKIILTRGIQGSGKSTWAKAWTQVDPEHRIRFNNDDIRNMFGKYWAPSREPMVEYMKKEFFKQAMLCGYDIIIDNMNLNPKEVSKIQNIIDIHNAWVNDKTIIKPSKIYSTYVLEFKDFFDISVDECIRRDSMRPNPVGKTVIKDTWKKYRSFILSEQSKSFINNSKLEHSDKERVVIFDLDGTIAYNTQGRPFYGEGTAEGISLDTPDNRMIEILNIYRQAGIRIGFLTGRTDTPEIRKATEDWINEHVGLGYEFLIMRPEGKFVSGEVCKAMLYKKYIEPKYRVIAVYEDSQKCVDMWRRLGILCLQPNDGNC